MRRLMVSPHWPQAALLAAVGGLLLLGLAAIARAESLEIAPLGYARRQMVWAVLGVFAACAVGRLPMRFVVQAAVALYAAGLLLLVAVYFFPAVHGAHRWIRFGPLGLQPSEFMKVFYVLVMARYLMHRTSHRRLVGLLMPLGLTLVPSLLVLREPDLGTATVFWPLWFCLLWGAGARRWHLLAMLLAGVCLMPLVWQQMSHEQRSRVTSLFRQTGPGERPVDDRYQLHQAKQMMALGGVWGSWLAGEAVDDRAVYHLPEAHTDFVLSLIAERFGLWGVALVLALSLFLVRQSLAVAEATRDPFPRLVAVGIAALFGIQLTINTAMTVGLLPITGLSLPLVSYGGSGLLAHGVALGLVLSVARRPGVEIAAEPFQFEPLGRRPARRRHVA